MIVRLSGRLLEKQPDHVVIDVQGVGYHAWITLDTYKALPDLDHDAVLLIYHQVRENSQELFGFANAEEREVFRQLISISGIGAKTAVTALSSVLPNELCQWIRQGDETAITSIRGIGLKTARRIIVDLKDKIGEPLPGEGGPPTTDNTSQAVQSLMALGYKQKEANRAIQTALKNLNANAPVESIIRAALRNE